jgi:hypothetical protein
MRFRRIILAVLSIAAARQLPSVDWLEQLKLSRVMELKASTHHVQGVDTDSRHVWVTSVDTPGRKGYLQEFSRGSGGLLRSVEVQEGDRFHPGGFATDDRSLWIPVAEYKRNSSALIQRRDKQSLKLEYEFAVPDHIGCIAVNPEFLVGGNWDSLDFYVWDHRGNLVNKISSTTSNAYQDMKFDSGYLVASGLLPDRTGAVDWIEFPLMKLVHRLRAGKTDRGQVFTREGMAIRDGLLLLLPEDDSSRLFFFSITGR